MPLPLVRIRPDGKSRITGRSAAKCLERRDRHPRVDGDDAGFVGKHRIEIDLADFREIGYELRELDEKELDRLSVRSGNVAVCLEDARYPGARDQAARQLKIERRQRQRLVADDFDRGAALPERDHRDRMSDRPLRRQ